MFMKWVAAAPVLGSVAWQGFANKLLGATGTAENVYERIGVRPCINARGTWTYLSGSLILPEVRRAMEAASLQFVDMFELQRGVGKRLAALSGAESAMVTSGAAGAMASAAAACIAGSDPAKIWQLPDTTGLKHEIVMLGGRIAFDSALRLSGGKLVIARTLEELPAAMNDQTAMVYTTWRDDRLSQALEITRRAKVPLLLGRCRWNSSDRQSFALRQNGRRPVLLQRRQGPARPAVRGRASRKKRSDRCGTREYESLGRRGLQADESR